MRVLLVATWWIQLVHGTSVVHADTTTDIPDHEDIEDFLINATTSEIRDKMLKELKGQTEEIQGYFDQLPSEEFKDNSEARKFMLYWENKGLKNIDTDHLYNITPQFRQPPESVHTIEVNDSYVPKYRITTSEEERMDKYGTFNSESSSSEISSETVNKKSKESSESEPSDSGDKKPKKKKGKKKLTTNLDPKEKHKKKKSKTDDEDKKKRKELVQIKINGNSHIRINAKEVKEQARTNHGKKNFPGIHHLPQMNLRHRVSSNKIENNIQENKYNLQIQSNIKGRVSKQKNKVISNDDIEKRLLQIQRKRIEQKDSFPFARI